ncbi:hypothetical protein BDZ89DRAFT_1037369 [Hymenopellis radicata]|nr:hypothetical protein BDZ89DRAFT_1037369 [Hymenopellis radicata]
MSHECPHCGLPPTKKPSRIPTQSPYETHLGTTIAFTPHDHVRIDIVNLVAHAKADIADLDRSIEKLETSLAEAKKERDETIAFRDAHLALFPPIHQLPVEVLLEIFHLTFEKPYDVFASSRSGPWLLGKVCRRWRQVAWSCPSLWTAFTLTVGGRTGHKVGTKVLFEGALSRSGKRNEFYIPLGDLKKTQISIIAKSAGSWHDASFEGALEDFEPFLKIGRMPSLVALGLDIRAVPYGNLDAYYRLLSSLGKHVPQLRRVTLSFRHPATSITDIKLSKIKFPWRQLTELVVPLDCIVLCQQLLACCPDLETLKDNHHTLTRLSLPCARVHYSDGKVLQRFVQSSECTVTSVELTFSDDEHRIVSPEASLSALPGIIDLRLSHPKGRFIDCLSDLTVVPKLRVLTITTTTISRSIWEAELKDTLIRVLSARYRSPEESSTGTNLQEVVVVLGKEDKRRLDEEWGKDCTIENLVAADFVEFRKLKERGLNLHLSSFRGSFFRQNIAGFITVKRDSLDSEVL